MTTHYLSQATGNIFQVVKRENGYVVTDRIGYLDTDGDFVKQDGLGFSMREEYLTGEGNLIEVVRTIGDCFYPVQKWNDIEVLREEARRD